MKISEVCKRTELTKRTIRFYMEKGLLQTQFQITNGRIVREFCEEDIGVLIDIAKLRKVGFTIQDIQNMQKSTEDVNDIVRQHCKKIEEDIALQDQILFELKEVQKRGNIPWRKVASILFRERPDYTNEKICLPLEINEVEEVPQKSLRIYIKHILGWGIIIGAFFLALLFVLESKQEQKIIKTSFYVTDIIIDDKWYDDEQPYATIHSTSLFPAMAEYFEFPQTVKVGSVEYYYVMQVDSKKPYTFSEIWIEIPYGEAKENNLLNEENEIQIEKVLSDKLLIEKYCTIRTLHD